MSVIPVYVEYSLPSAFNTVILYEVVYSVSFHEKTVGEKSEPDYTVNVPFVGSGA